MRIDARDGDSFEQMLRRFTRSVNNSGVLREFRASQRFTSKSEAERVKRRRSARARAKVAAKAAERG